MIVVSIVIALGIAELQAEVVRILRGELKPYWIHSVWIFILLLVELQYFWAQFESRSMQDQWDFLDLWP